MATLQQLTKEQQREAYKNDWIMRNCNRCEIVPFKYNKIGKCPFYKNEDKQEEFNGFMKFFTCPVQIKLINELKSNNEKIL